MQKVVQGVWEKDEIRKDDSFLTFEEIFDVARKEKVRMLLVFYTIKDAFMITSADGSNLRSDRSTNCRWTLCCLEAISSMTTSPVALRLCGRWRS